MAMATCLFLICLNTVAFTLENLALHKEAQMSSQRSNYGADAAVDGNTIQTPASGTCPLTEYRGLEAWWSVDLNGTFAITQLTIYLLNIDTFRFRFYSVHVTDDLDNWNMSVPCAANGDRAGAQTSVVDLNCDAKGRYVTIWLNNPVQCTASDVANRCDILQLCEVEVLGCQPGNYGQDCNMTCPVNCRDDVCAIDDGKCYSCKDGYLGTYCDQVCKPGVYGQNCHHICIENCLIDTRCDNVTGFCHSGCKPGWTGDKCNHKCLNGRYGTNCDGVCSQNCHSPCNKVSGECDEGCINGWEGFFCDQTCRFQKYGFNCSLTCTHCEQGCHHVNGECCSQSSSSVAWALTALLSVTIVCLLVVAVLLWKRIQISGLIKNRDDKTGNHEARYENQSDSSKKKDQDSTTYEELQTQNLERSVYDSLRDSNYSYMDTSIK